MDLQQRIKAFAKLGDFLSQFSRNGIQRKENIAKSELFFDGFNHQIKLAGEHNGWFTRDNVLFALESWSKVLTIKNINQWTDRYSFNNVHPKIIAIIMAGNIPLVGFHDFLSVLISGHRVLVKLSSNDKYLLPFLAKCLETIEPQFKGKISFTENKLEDFNAVIATGSNNTARYFEYYFKGNPSIIRKNRNSVAVLNGKENQTQLEALSEDIFRYYGLGCRNVSKLFVPKDYNFDLFFKSIYKWHPIIHDAKYANNYDYNKAVYLMSEFNILENGFMMLKEDKGFSSPIATLFYEKYDSIDELKNRLNAYRDDIQCIASDNYGTEAIPFGNAQKPQLWDYADGIDTVDFLLKL